MPTLEECALEIAAWAAWEAAGDKARDEDMAAGRRYDKRIYQEKAHAARMLVLYGNEKGPK
mgnify:CR=1 FL=1